MEAKAPCRRSFFTSTFSAAAALSAQTQNRDYAGSNPVRYPDPDILSLDKRFDKYRLGITPIRRLHIASTTGSYDAPLVVVSAMVMLSAVLFWFIDASRSLNGYHQ